MAQNRGKDFEDKIRDAFEAVPDTSVVRLPDPVMGYLGYRNICDFIVYHYPYQYFIECKSVHGNTLSIHSNDPKKKYGLITNNQWEGMLKEGCKKGVIAGVICWWIDRDVTKFIPIQTLQMLRSNGYKSVKYNLISVPTTDIYGKKKRIFFDYDMEDFFARSSPNDM